MHVKGDFWLHAKQQDTPHMWPHQCQEEEKLSSGNKDSAEEPLGWGRILDRGCPQDVSYKKTSENDVLGLYFYKQIRHLAYCYKLCRAFRMRYSKTWLLRRLSKMCLAEGVTPLKRSRPGCLPLSYICQEATSHSPQPCAASHQNLSLYRLCCILYTQRIVGN